MIGKDILAILILIVIVVLFASQKIPLALASLIGALLMMAAGLLTPAELCAGFGNQICVLLVCASIVGVAAFETGLAGRLGEFICKNAFIVHSEKRFLLAILICSGIMSMFVANIPVVALFIPVISAVSTQSGGKVSPKNIIMAMGFAANAGGSATLIGASQNMTGQATLQATTGDSMTMFTLLPAGLVMMAVLLVYYATLGYYLQQKCFDFPDVEVVSQTDQPEFRPTKAAIVILCYIWMIVGFIGGIWNFGTVALIAAIVVILTGCIPFQKALQKSEWNTAITVAAALVTVEAINTSGAGLLIAKNVLRAFGGESASPILMLGVAMITASLLSCIMQNNAVTAVLIPIFCTVAAVIGSNPVTFAIAIICGCNICYATPISTSPITMTLVGGYRFNDYVKVGGTLLLITDIIMMVLLPFLYPL